MITCRFAHGGTGLLRHVVVHALVERGGALLLVKRAPHLGEGGKWGLPGGFLDRDETVAQGALRELLEETGWTGEVVSLLRINSRPGRPGDEQNVAFDLVITPHAQVGTPDDESTAVEWIPIERLPPLETLAFDHGESVALYLRTRGRPAPPPMLE